MQQYDDRKESIGFVIPGVYTGVPLVRSRLLVLSSNSNKEPPPAAHVGPDPDPDPDPDPGRVTGSSCGLRYVISRPFLMCPSVVTCDPVASLSGRGSLKNSCFSSSTL